LILVEEGHEVIVAGDGLHALELLRLYEVDMIIVDIQMPRFNGFQFVNTVRNNSQLEYTSIAFSTGNKDKDSVVQAAKLGADFYLIKPIVREQFLEKIREHFSVRPPKAHPKFVSHEPFFEEVKIRKRIYVTCISDIGIEILIDQDLEEGQVIELASSMFHEALPGVPLVKVLWCKPHDASFKKAFLIFVDQTVETVRKVQSFIQRKNQSGASLKYPKSR
jgi:CheY-like chemotaxis protein